MTSDSKAPVTDALLISWLILDVLWDAAVVGTLFYVVFWRGHSGWWFLLLIVLSGGSSLYKALRKRFQVAEEESP